MRYISALRYCLWVFLAGVIFVGGVQSASAAPSVPSVVSTCVGTGLSINMYSPGATHYALRVNNIANGWDATCPTSGWPAGDVCGLTTSPFNHSYSFAGTVNYDVWAHACDGTGCSSGATHSYSNCSAPSPSATTSSASGITQTSAVLNGYANANGTPATASFMFSTANPGTCSGSWPWANAIASGSTPVSGTGSTPYSVTLGNISPGSTYYYCAYATNGIGTGYGGVQQFTTTALASCNFNGSTIASGSGVTAYASSTVPSGSTCTSQFRSCSNGTLSGSYQYGSCSVSAAASCNFNGSTIASGSGVTAYASSTVPSGSTCTSQFRSCSNGTLSGSYQYGSCSVSAPAVTNFNICNGGCTTGTSFSDSLPLSGFSLAPGASQTLYACPAGCTGGSSGVSSDWTVSGTASAVSLSSTVGTSITVTGQSAGVATITATPQ